MFNISSNLKALLKTLAFSVPLGVTFVDVVGYVAKVEGFSMQPVLNPHNSSGDYVFLHNWPIATNSFDKVSRGDIVSLISPRDPRQRLIKRVIGLGGDIVETHGYKTPYIRVPQGHCWIEGDHRGNSLDSNIFGPIAIGLIKSKAKCIVWPPNRWQSLSHNQESVVIDRTSSASSSSKTPPNIALVDDAVTVTSSETFTTKRADKLS